MTICDRKKEFARLYVENGGDGTQAAIEAGYSKRTAKNKQWELRQEPAVKEEIREQQIKLFTESSVKAQKTLVGLLDSKSETVRYNASRELLAQAGFSVAQEVKIEDSRSKKDLIATIKALLPNAGVEILEKEDDEKPRTTH